MARTVDTSSTFENWRQNYNDLATDVGGLGNLTTGNKSSVVNAINYIMDQYFYFQDFEYDGSDGATSQTVFSGVDNAGNTFAYSPGKILVFKNGLLLRSGTDYTAVNGTSITLASSASNSDIIRMSVFTGSYENVGAGAADASVQWTLAGSVLYNHNLGGLILNADSSLTTSLGVADSIQLEGNTYANGSIYLNAQNDLRFQDSDSSHYVAIQAPGTVSANVTLTLPADDGTSGQLLSTDGSGVLAWASPSTATDVTVTANNSANETVYPIFVDGATGAQGVESDTGLTYNPSSGTLTSTVFVGALTGNVTGNTSGTAATVTSGTQSSITATSNLVTVGTIGTGVWQGTAINQTYLTGQSGTNTGDQTTVSGNAGTATALATGRTIGMTGDVVWTSASFTGSGNVTGTSVIQAGSVDLAMLSASGTRNSGTFYRGDGTFAVPGDANTWRGVTAGGQTLASNETLAFTAGTNVSITESGGAVTINSTDQFTGTSDVSVGTGSTDAHRGDQGATAYTHSQATHAPTGAEANVQSDWTAASGDAHILNKPTTITGGQASAITANSAKTSFPGFGTTASTALVGDTSLLAIGTSSSTAMAGDTSIPAAVTLNSNTGNFTFGAGIGISTNDINVAVNASGGSNLTADTNGISLTATPAFTTVTATGDITANSSDARLKDVIGTIESPLEKLSKISGYEFTWNEIAKSLENNTFDDKIQVGVLAQELEEILPSVVKPSAFEGYKTVQYEKIVPLLIESIKELKTELDELKSSNS